MYNLISENLFLLTLVDTCIQNCINNINKCQDSFIVENHISLAMEMLFDGKIPPLYKFEDSCLNLASSGVN